MGLAPAAPAQIEAERRYADNQEKAGEMLKVMVTLRSRDDIAVLRGVQNRLRLSRQEVFRRALRLLAEMQ